MKTRFRGNSHPNYRFGTSLVDRIYFGNNAVWMREVPTSIALKSGSFAYSGEPFDIRVDNFPAFALERGWIAVDVIQMDFQAHLSAVLEQGDFTLTGFAAEFDVPVTLQAELGSFALTGFDVATQHDWNFSFDSGSYALTGFDADFAHNSGEIDYVVEILISSGEVTADLTDFPVFVDLTHMPVGFWSNVKADGGDIRLYLADGVTPIPFDLVKIDTVNQVGKLFFKRNLLAASNNITILKSNDSSLNLLPATDTYGRNAVWSDYHRVVLFDELLDRTGSGTTLTLVGTTSVNAAGNLVLTGFGHVRIPATRFTTWTIAASIIPANSASANNAILSYTEFGISNTPRESLVWRNTNEYGLWNATDTWLVNGSITGVGSQDRLAASHATTANRKLYRNGAGTTDVTVAQKPSGTNPVYLYVGAEDESLSERFNGGQINFVYLRNGALSDAWLAGESSNWLNPSGFYTITEL